MDPELFKLEIQDVKRNIGVLQQRVDKLEELATQPGRSPASNAVVRRSPRAAQSASSNTAQVDPVHPDSDVASAIDFSTPDDRKTDDEHPPDQNANSFLAKQLEQRQALATSPTAHSRAQQHPPAFQLAVSASSQEHEKTQNRQSSSTSHDESSKSATKNTAQKDGLEVVIGKHLNKIGISFLVIGCALALIYQFQYFTPLLKILSGLFAAVGLIAAGEFFEKKPTLAWYGRSLTGGGWALCYFTIYAAYHFDSVRIINNAFLDFSLLFCAAAGAVWHSFKYKSETITCISLTLAFVTIAISTVTSFSMLACALLVGALAGIVLKMRWYNLMVYGEVLLYGVYTFDVLPKLMAGQNTIFGLSAVDGNYPVAACFSTFCWAVFNFVIFTAKYATPKQRNYVITSTIINSLAYIPTMLLIMQPTHADWRFAFLLGSAGAYAICAISADRNNMPEVMTVHTFIALALGTMAIPFKLTGDWITVSWCAEIPLLIWTGLKYQMPVMRRFAAIAAALSLGRVLCTPFASLYTHSSLNPVLGIAAVAAYAVSAWLYCASRLEVGNASANKIAFRSYFNLSVLILLLTIADNVAQTWLPMAYVFSGSAIVMLGFYLKDRSVRTSGLLIIFCMAAFSYCTNVEITSRIASAAAIPILFYLGETYKKAALSINGTSDRLTEYAFFAAASTVLTILLQQLLLPLHMATGMLAVEGLCFLFYGFAAKDKRARTVAFAILSGMVYRFVAEDTWNSIALLGTQVHQRLVYAIVYCLTLAIAAGSYLSPKLQVIAAKDFKLAFYSYGALLSFVAVSMTLLEVPAPWLALTFSLGSLSLIALGVSFESVKPLRTLGTFALMLSQFAYLSSSIGNWDPRATILIVMMQFALSVFYRYRPIQERVPIETGIEHCYGAAGTITLALLLSQIMPAHLLTIAWTLQGISTLTIGFNWQDRPYRVYGLLLLGLVIVRLLFVELASLATIYRILSFIAAGIVLLVASFAYARMNTTMQQESPRPTNP